MVASLVFVVGNSRSGTTMVARMLELNDAIHTLREVHFFEELWVPADKGRVLGRDEALTLASTLIERARERYQHESGTDKYSAESATIVDALPERTGEAVFAATLRHEARAVGRSVAVEQTPRNVYFAGEILELYPDAVVVAVIRDPRDVLASQKNWWRKTEQDGEKIARTVRFRHWANYHPWLTSQLWRGGARAQLALQGRERVVSIRYEDVLTDGASELRTVTDALGLEFDPKMLEVRRFGSSLKSDEITTGLDASRSGVWRDLLRPSEVWISQRMCAAEYRAFGYEPQRMSTPWVGLVTVLAALPVKLVLVFALNLKRSRNLIGSVRRRLSR